MKTIINLMPFRNLQRDVPEGQLKIAQRFNAGIAAIRGIKSRRDERSRLTVTTVSDGIKTQTDLCHAQQDIVRVLTRAGLAKLGPLSHLLPPLRGFGLYHSLAPTVETVGYSRSSLRDSSWIDGVPGVETPGNSRDVPPASAEASAGRPGHRSSSRCPERGQP